MVRPTSPSLDSLRAPPEVDAVLRDIIARDCYGFGANVIEVKGTLDARIQSVLEKVH